MKKYVYTKGDERVTVETDGFGSLDNFMVTGLIGSNYGGMVHDGLDLKMGDRASIAKMQNVAQACSAKLEVYDGDKLIGTQTEAPYQATLKAPTTGKHELRAVVTDDQGKTGESSCMVNCTTATSAFSLYSTFKNEGAVPQNWHISNGSTERVGGGLPYTSGPRILRFTNAKKDFEYGLLVQNSVGETTAWAKFGDRTSNSFLTLHAGHYAVKYKLCNWNKPEFAPVTVAIEKIDGQTVASQTYTPTVNIGASTSKAFSGSVQQTLEFDIPETGDYVIAFYTDTTKNADFVLGLVTLHAISFGTTGVNEVRSKKEDGKGKVFDLSGRQLSKENLKPGLYIIDGRKVVR